MELSFEGDINVWVGLAVALVAAVAIFRLYRRETRYRSERYAPLLPLLRCAAVAMIVLMLTGPVLRGSVGVADLSRVIVFVDSSKSMGLTDATMPTDRKMLSARRLGWIDSTEVDTSLYDAAQLLASVVKPSEGTPPDETLRHYRRFVRAAIDTLSDDDPYKEQLVAELSQPLDKIADSDGRSMTDAPLSEQLQRLQVSAQSWRSRLESEYRQRAGQTSPSDSKMNDLSNRLDELSRWQRAEAALLDDQDSLLASLAGSHHVDLLAISGNLSDSETVRLWQPLQQDDFPDSFDPHQPIGPKTDLVSQIDSLVGQLPTSQRLAVVLMSDGQHNRQHAGAASPLHLARLLGRRGVPIFPVGFGALEPPADLAVLGVQTPEAVFADDRVKGDILIKDNMPPGQPMQINIDIEGQNVWSRQLTTGGRTPRNAEFDFPIKDLVENRLAESVGDADSISMPLTMTVSIEPVEGETRDDNNSYQANVRAITRPRRALLIDGRPRWEFRYLRNLLDRDDHWQVNQVLARGSGGRMILPRGNRDGAFPADRNQLFTYDVIVLGEVSASAFDDRELDWIHQFVASGGGGLMLIDGLRGKLRSHSDSPLKTLFPIRWTANHSAGLRNTALNLTDRGRATAALAFDGDSDQSTIQWSQLPPPRWIAPVEALPGCETLVAAANADQMTPALVMRRYGAGTVLYSGFDDSWRWRYEVGDEYHGRYWNQIASFIMESPYAIHDRFVSIDTGGFTYQPGESANLKVRLRDQRGQPIVNAKADAILYRDDSVVATVPLQGAAESGGVLRGTTKPLDPGSYQVGIRTDRFSEEVSDVRAEFVVLGDTSGELSVLSCNEELLRQMAELSGGQYLREEDVARLPDLLAPQADGKDEVAELALWRSWYWFLPLVGLFTMEWLLRKRMGLM